MLLPAFDTVAENVFSLLYIGNLKCHAMAQLGRRRSEPVLTKRKSFPINGLAGRIRFVPRADTGYGSGPEPHGAARPQETVPC